MKDSMPENSGHLLEEIKSLKLHINELELANNTLRENFREIESRFNQVAENAGEFIWEVDRNGMYTYASPIIEKLLGYKPVEVIRFKYFYDFFLPEEKAALKEMALSAFEKKESFRDFENRNLTRTGEIKWFLTSGSPVLNERGELVCYRGVDMDITGRKKAEIELKKHVYELEMSQMAAVNREKRILDLKEDMKKLKSRHKE